MIHVLMIHHKHGQNVTAHDTAKGADEELERYVADEWDAEINEPYPKDEPVKVYFEKAEDEWFEVLELTLQQEEQ